VAFLLFVKGRHPLGQGFREKKTTGKVGGVRQSPKKAFENNQQKKKEAGYRGGGKSSEKNSTPKKEPPIHASYCHRQNRISQQSPGKKGYREGGQ